MASRYIADAARVLRNNPNIRTLAEFWICFGRPDFVLGVTYESLAGAPIYQSILYAADKELKRRIAIDKDIQPKPRPIPLKGFLLIERKTALINGKPKAFDAYPCAEYFLRTTKGWGYRSGIDRGEAGTLRDRGLTVRSTLPGKRFKIGRRSTTA